MLEQCVKSASMFDEVVLYTDGQTRVDITIANNGIRVVGDGRSRSIVEGFNYAVEKTTSEWVCPFCDDDYFNEANMGECLDRIRAGNYDDADVVHSQVFVGSGSWGETSVDYGTLRQRDQLPHGSIFRKAVFDELGGYQTECYSDWDLWLRFAKAGKIFRYFEKPTYHFRANRQGCMTQVHKARFGGHGEMHRIILENVDKS